MSLYHLGSSYQAEENAKGVYKLLFWGTSVLFWGTSSLLQNPMWQGIGREGEKAAFLVDVLYPSGNICWITTFLHLWRGITSGVELKSDCRVETTFIPPAPELPDELAVFVCIYLYIFFFLHKTNYN